MAGLIRRRWKRLLALLVVCLGLSGAAVLAGPATAWAAPVSWQEVPPAPQGRQWWDAGSLRWTRDGHLRLLSRFQPSSEEEGARRAGELYLMEVDCQQQLYRDVSVNGLHRFGATWQLATGEPLITAVIEQACRAAPPLS